MSAPVVSDMSTLAQADALLLIARLLNRPSKSTLAALGATDGELQELAGLAGLGGASPLGSLAGAVREARDLDTVLWAGEHSRLFEGAVACPINETAYVRRDKGAILADISGFYKAFGFGLSDESGEKADHLITELEFVSLLLVMLAQAKERGAADDEEVTRTALHAFACEHLDEWLPLFCERLAATTGLVFYQRVAAALQQVVDAVFTAHAVPRAERLAVDFPVDDPGTPYECGMAPCVKQSNALDIGDAPRLPDPSRSDAG